MRNFDKDDGQAYSAAEMAVFEFLSDHPGHGIAPCVWRDIRAIVHEMVGDTVFESRREIPFGRMLQLARVIANALFYRLLGEEGDGGLAVLPVAPEDDRGSGGAVGPEYDYPAAVNIDELRRLACAVAAKVCYDARYRGDAIAAAADDGFLHAWQHYDPARGTLEGWVATCARSKALDVVRKGMRTDQREPLSESPEHERDDVSCGVRRIDPLMMKTTDRLAKSGLTPRQYQAYIRDRAGAPVGEGKEGERHRDALRDAKERMRLLLEDAGYGYEDFFLAV